MTRSALEMVGGSVLHLEIHREWLVVASEP